MRILAVDPGTKRVGLALSDPTATIASALPALEAEPPETLADRLAGVASLQHAERLVVGLPLNLDGTRGPAASAAERLASDLRRTTRLPVETVDERLTTAAAERSLLEGGVKRVRRKQAVDGVAAALLLQGYLDRMRSGRRDG